MKEFEEEAYGTSDFNGDSDGDGFGDAEEVAYGSNPMDSASVANAAPQNIDLNGSSIAENQPVGVMVGEFNATDPDAGAFLVDRVHEVSGG